MIADTMYIPARERERRLRLETDPELVEMRELLEEHDHLFLDLQATALTAEEQKLLDNLQEFFILKEEEQWEGGNPIVTELIYSYAAVDYPAIRMMLGKPPVDQD